MLNLVVIRVANLEQSRQFYSALGLDFTVEQHGTGPKHLAAQLGSVVFEIYPVRSGMETHGVRLGFEVTSVREAMVAAELAEGKVLIPPGTDSGTVTAVLQDPDGHKIEITEVLQVRKT